MIDVKFSYFLALGNEFGSFFAGEHAVRDEFPEAVIIRPSDMYGSGDRFLRHYAAFWRRQGKGMPLWKKGEQTFKQPVFVSDVAQGIVNILRNPDTNGQLYQAIG